MALHVFFVFSSLDYFITMNINLFYLLFYTYFLYSIYQIGDLMEVKISLIR